MEEQQIYSGHTTTIGKSHVTLTSMWRENVLIGVANDPGFVIEKSWLRQGEIIIIDNRRWVMLGLYKSEVPDAPKVMVQLVAVED